MLPFRDCKRRKADGSGAGGPEVRLSRGARVKFEKNLFRIKNWLLFRKKGRFPPVDKQKTKGIIFGAFLIDLIF
jgi:hypothetical protein